MEQQNHEYEDKNWSSYSDDSDEITLFSKADINNTNMIKKPNSKLKSEFACHFQLGHTTKSDAESIAPNEEKLLKKNVEQKYSSIPMITENKDDATVALLETNEKLAWKPKLPDTLFAGLFFILFTFLLCGCLYF